MKRYGGRQGLVNSRKGINTGNNPGLLGHNYRDSLFALKPYGAAGNIAPANVFPQSQLDHLLIIDFVYHAANLHGGETKSIKIVLTWRKDS